MQRLFADVAYALRGFRRAPAFTAVAVLTLALGIGATVTIFTLVDRVLLRALPFRHPETLVSISNGFTSRGVFLRMRAESRTMSALAAYDWGSPFTVNGAGQPVELVGSSVSADFFTTLGIGALAGRTFLPDESHIGHDRVMILSHALWTQRFGGDPHVLGRTVRVDSVSRTIVGIMPATFQFPGKWVDFWYPTVLDLQGDTAAFWGQASFGFIGRLTSGTTFARARQDTRDVFNRIRPEIPWRLPDAYGDSLRVQPLRDELVGSSRSMLQLMLGGVALVLLVACANVANLVLARTASRRRELAIRTAIGASRGRIVRQLLTENVVLAIIGGAVGLLLATWGVDALIALLPADTPRLAEVHIDPRVFAVAIALISAAGIACGIAPALRVARPPTVTTATRTGDTLVIAQMTLAVVLVLSAGLLGKSLWALRHVDPGFTVDHLMTARLPLPQAARDSGARATLFTKAVLERIAQLPGVRSAAAATAVPLSGAYAVTPIQTDAHPTPDRAEPPEVNIDFVTPDYFRTMGIPLRAGRTFTDADRTGTLNVALVDEAAARRLWPGENPIGQRVRHSWKQDWFTVVGVVGIVKRDSLSAEPRPQFYRPLWQGEGWEVSVTRSFVVRTTADPGLLAPTFRRAVQSVDPTIPLADISSADAIVAHSVDRPRVTTTLLGGFALIALLLGAAGVYGVMSHAVARRTREIGIRMALGAHPSDVLWLVLRQGTRLVFFGVALGLAGSFVATSALRSMLYGVSPTDPLLFAAVPALFACVALAATLSPARRAAAVAPTIAIRTE